MIYKGIMAVDFDGTLCEHRFPAIGEPKHDIINYVKEKEKDGWILILNTCRDGEYLEQAKKWCEQMQIPVSHYNENVPEIRDQNFGKNKIVADIYLDDKALNIKDINK